MTATTIKKTGRVVGGLFLSAFAFYDGGSALIKAATGSTTSSSAWSDGSCASPRTRRS
jgi:hypothetical protein